MLLRSAAASSLVRSLAADRQPGFIHGLNVFYSEAEIVRVTAKVSRHKGSTTRSAVEDASDVCVDHNCDAIDLPRGQRNRMHK
jgi:hypothetical protein